MLKTSFLLLFFLLQLSALAQLNWYQDMRSAQTVALSKQQLIVMDFWAIWCGPCKAMDKQMWSLPEMHQLSKNFVALKIDVDVERALAQQYQTRSIPKLVIANVAGEVIYEQIGYGGPDPYLTILRNLPENVQSLNRALMPVMHHNATDEDYLLLGQEYQKLALKSRHELLKLAFLEKSDQALKKASRKSELERTEKTAELYLILNEAYRNNPETAMKKLTKLEDTSQKDEMLELKRFVAAYCYKCMGDEEKLNKEKQQISNQAYLKQLDGNE